MKKKNEKPEVVEERIYDLNCYKCDVGLKVKSGQSVYMCPKCGAMFRVRVTERLVKDVSTVTVAEASYLYSPLPVIAPQSVGLAMVS